MSVEVSANFYGDLINTNSSGQICLETLAGQTYTYGDLDDCSGRLANLLVSCGIAPGDRVAAQVEKSPQAVFLYLACLRAGAVYLPLNAAYRLEETDYFLGDARPKVVVCSPETCENISALCRGHDISHVFTLDNAGQGELTEKCRTLPPTFGTVPLSPHDLAAILYSSGTTGKAKGAMLSHQNLRSNARTLVQVWGFTGEDVLLHALPIFHVHGLFVGVHCGLMSGARMIFLQHFDPAQVCSLLPRATVFMGVPTYYTRLLSVHEFRRDSCRGIRLFTSGSAPLLPDTFEQFQERTGHRILERYGLTETLMNTSNPLAGPRLPGSVGVALDGVEVRIAGQNDRVRATGEVGEIQVRGPNVFSGYWHRPEMSAACFTSDGYFRTGDLGKMDEQGYVFIVGRSKDVIISGGYNVYPKEVEDRIDEFEGVQESAVIGMPHPDFGEAVMAVVIARTGATIDVEAVRANLRERLANYKLPKLIVQAAELPRNAMGKVQKNLLRETLRPAWLAFLGER